MSLIPDDVRRQLMEAGVKFDENGNIIEDQDEKFILDTQDDNQDDDQDENQDDLDDQEDLDEDDDSEIEDDEDTNDDDDEDDEDEDEKSSKKKQEKTKESDEDSKPKLTPRELKRKEDEDKLTMDQVRENVQNLLKQYGLLDRTEPVKQNTPVQQHDDDDSVVQELRREVEEFRRMRYQSFADNVKSKVADKQYGVSFQEIIGSSQWEEFLSSSAYGSNIGELYKSAIRNHDIDATLFFFDDFASRYLKSAKVKEDKSVKQDDLDDLAVPDKTKTSKTPRRKKFDFEEDDYALKLDEAERGIISREEFVKFNDEFELALSKGRVKPSR